MQRTRDSSNFDATVIAALAFALLAAACSTTTPPVDIKSTCLPSPVYSLSDQQEFAKEERALDPVKDKQVIRFLGDYHAMRLADLTCQAGAK